ncbi:helix-turn-helix domain-containing protein [Aquimarina spongiae]|uniref:AraC-type DNA-binding protein n=1 Tax=Aquimarina spongiae TaxID=570521 RepID=A0A1M6BD78_9FLAO|nr:helix-turn-helix domain-containing protein [Aquimarina spongiae]SHI46692.1 AraC-type DNA-binding protein [Aquimarina spongiae]
MHANQHYSSKEIADINIADDRIQSIIQKLDELEKTDFFFSSECNLYNTAKTINSNTSYLSRIINIYKLKTFNEYVNHLRIQHCIKKLKTDRRFKLYTIKAISNELGYKSVNTFIVAFKKQTGYSHAVYLKGLR